VLANTAHVTFPLEVSANRSLSLQTVLSHPDRGKGSRTGSHSASTPARAAVPSPARAAGRKRVAASGGRPT